MTKYISNTSLVLKEKGGFGKYMQAIASAIKTYRQSMDQYGEAIIKVKAR
ncbi:hypothetical protein NLX67_04855 [Domibacillus sp. A3M-37]|nr:hypothetical protein [Domibacillus sp. A3M-37]MCP3761712.1 hypothetical protein [Domibacillus sp. A3M-37]